MSTHRRRARVYRLSVCDTRLKSGRFADVNFGTLLRMVKLRLTVQQANDLIIALRHVTLNR